MEKKSILVTEFFPDDALKLFANSKNLRVDVIFGLKEKGLIQIIHKYDALVLQHNLKITKSILDRAERLKLIIRAGTGLDNINTDYASQLGIAVMNTPVNGDSVAELTICMMLALARNLVLANDTYKSNLKVESIDFIGSELNHKVLGILGLGRIGIKVAEFAKAFGMKVLAYDKYNLKKKCSKLNISPASFSTLLKKSDYITIHVPFSEKNINLIDKKEFDQMKTGVKILNLARDRIINEKELYIAIKSGKISGAALDVLSKHAHRRLLKCKNVIVTPHIGGMTIDAQKRINFMAAEEILRFFRKST